MDTNDQVIGYIRKLRFATYAKTAFFILSFVIVYSFLFHEKDDTAENHIAVIKIAGEISDESPRTSALAVLSHIDRALENPKTKAILLELNSGGGSPVQAEAIHNQLIKIRMTSNIKVIASVKELCASACLYIASASEKIYVHNSSLIGSIGVIMASWDVTQLAEKLGLKRRSYSIGNHKEFINPFSVPDPVVSEHIEKTLLPPLFEQFKKALIIGRGEKLSLNNDKLFSGLLWGGQDAVKLGLADDIKSTYEVRQMLSEEHSTNQFSDYTKIKKLSVQNLFSSEFWADVILKVMNSPEVKAEY